MEDSPLPDDSGVKWIRTAHPPTPRSKLLVFASFAAAGNRADVESVGLSNLGVTFVRKGRATTIPWGEIVPSKWQYGRGYLVLKTKERTQARSGPWVVDAVQGRAILTHPGWTDPRYAHVVIPKWLE